jgi:hypothetical protein
MPKPYSMPAYVELRPDTPDEPDGVFVDIMKVLRCPRLQDGVLDKRRFSEIICALRKRGGLIEVPYIGPKDRV